MDPRQPQPHPFTRNTASPYSRGPFQTSANPSPFPPSTHAPNAPPVYQEHQRRPSGPPYYAEQRSYTQDGAPMPGPGHSRNQSSSSIGHGTPVMRERPPPFSPQQQPPQQPPHHNSHSYAPPPPRPPPVSVGPPAGFPSGRELPSLTSLGRPTSTGMSISSMLGGPSREPPQSQYPAPISTAGPSSTLYTGPAHASPRITTTSGPEYPSYRRPQTPEHQRYEVHDRRANSAGSPQGISQLTPESRRWGTPQAHTYSQRPPPPDRGIPPPDERREQQPIRVSNPNIPPRPSSQPTAFNPPPSRIPDGLRGPLHSESVFGRREEQNSRAIEHQSRAEPSYQRPPAFADRENPVYAYAERERREREAAIQRDRERERDREQRERAALYERDRLKAEYESHRAQLLAQNAQHRPPPEPREQPAWMRPDYARPGYEQPSVEQRPPPPQPPTTNYDHPTTTAPYANPVAFTPNDTRYPPGSQPSSMPPQYGSIPSSQYEANIQERQRAALAQQMQQQHEQLIYDRLSQRAQYPPHDSPGRRPAEEPQQTHQQRFLGVQEINRKGRVSPLPQAVQGAQAQIGTPGGEPGIKSEFGRMFSGIGSGVGSATGAPAVTAGPQGGPFSSSGQLRREDLEHVAQNSPIENGGHGIARSSSQGGNRRRKLKEDDSRGDDEDSTGRQTPSGRGKRMKLSDHNHGPRRHHHHHRRPDDQISSPPQSNLTPFKSVKGGSAIPSPPSLEPKENPHLHHHIIHVPAPKSHPRVPSPVRAPPPNVVVPLPHMEIHSKSVLDAVAHLPRRHLGHEYYHSTLKPAGSNRSQNLSFGFESTPTPLPRFEGNENCTFTIRVPRVHLSATSRAEITSRRALWGTQIYSDDSDVIAACIHQGWFRGEWPDDVDISLLDLEHEGPWPTVSKGNAQYDGTLTDPPPGGPMEVPPDRDLHITILVLPQLEKYSSCTRYGIRSREWGGKHNGYTGVHDGMSFMILKIKWIDGVDSFEGRIEGKRMKLRPQSPGEDDKQLEYLQVGQRLEQNGHGERDGVIQESFERSGPAPLDSELGNIKGIGRNWWKGNFKTKRITGPNEEPTVPKVEVQGENEPLAVQVPEQVDGNGDTENSIGYRSASASEKTPTRPINERIADMLRRDDF